MSNRSRGCWHQTYHQDDNVEARHDTGASSDRTAERFVLSAVEASTQADTELNLSSDL